MALGLIETLRIVSAIFHIFFIIWQVMTIFILYTNWRQKRSREYFAILLVFLVWLAQTARLVVSYLVRIHPTDNETIAVLWASIIISLLAFYPITYFTWIFYAANIKRFLARFIEEG